MIEIGVELIEFVFIFSTSLFQIILLHVSSCMMGIPILKVVSCPRHIRNSLCRHFDTFTLALFTFHSFDRQRDNCVRWE